MSGEDSFNFQLFCLHWELLFYLNFFFIRIHENKKLSHQTPVSLYTTLLNSFIRCLNLFIFLSCFPRIYLHRNPDFFHSTENTKSNRKQNLSIFFSNSRASIGFAFTGLIYFMVFIFPKIRSTLISTMSPLRTLTTAAQTSSLWNEKIKSLHLYFLIVPNHDFYETCW